MAVTAITASSSSSTSLSLNKKNLNFPCEYHSLYSIPKLKPTKALELKTQSPHNPHFSHPFRCDLTRASASVSMQPPESNSESEQDEYSDDDDEQNPTERRLFVGNLSFEMTNSELGEIFGEAGRVKYVEIVYDRATGRSKGYAIMKMGTFEEAKEAIRMYDGSQIGGRTLMVSFPEFPRGGEREVTGSRIQTNYQVDVKSVHKLYAGNLARNITSQGLREAFTSQPGLLSAKVISRRNNGKSRGFGFITFSSAQAAESALSAMNGMELEGRSLLLNMAEGTAPISPQQMRDSESNFDTSEMFSSFRNEQE